MFAYQSRPRKKGSVMERWQKFFLSESAASAVEYGLLIAGIAFVIFASIMLLGQGVFNRFYAGAAQLFQ